MNSKIIMIITGASLWGTISWYVKNLYAYGFTAMEVVTLRVVTTAIFLAAYFLFKNPSLFKLNKASDIKYFVGTGVISIVFFNYCLFTAISLSTIPVATALLYTAPAFVTFLSVILFKEPLTSRKLSSLLFTVVGTTLVVGLVPVSTDSLAAVSILFGIGSGLGYALYSIFSKYALVHYSSSTVTIYTFFVASFSLLPFFPFTEKGMLLLDPVVLLYAFGLGIIPTGFAYLLYTYGLNYVEASRASILSTVEPVVATLIGVFIFKEHFSFIQGLGMFSILLAVMVINSNTKTNNLERKAL